MRTHAPGIDRPALHPEIALFVPAILLLLFIAGCEHSDPSSLKIGDRPVMMAPAALDGKRIRVPDDFSGSIIIVRFWTDTCQACAIEMPQLDALYRAYRNNGLVIVAVNEGQQPDVVRSFVSTHGMTYPVVLDSSSIMKNYYGIPGYPTSFILDRKGVVRHKIIGSANRETYEKFIRELL